MANDLREAVSGDSGDDPLPHELLLPNPTIGAGPITNTRAFLGITRSDRTNMSPSDEKRATELKKLAESYFGSDLTVREQQVLELSANSEDSHTLQDGDRSVTIRAELIRWLVTDIEAAKYIDPKGIRLRSATISGHLDFDNCNMSASLVIVSCDIEGQVRINSSTTRTIKLEDCNLKDAVLGENAVIRGSLHICRSTLNSEIGLDHVQIDGQLSFAGSNMTSTSKNISLNGARINGSVLLTDGFQASGSIYMNGAQMWELDCSEATLFSEKDVALSLDGANISGDVFLSKGFACVGEIRLPGAHVIGNLECIDAKIGSLICHNMTIDGDLMWIAISNADRARLSLVGAKVKSIRDEKASWPLPGNLELDGLIYEQLTIHLRSENDPTPQGELPQREPFNANDRIEWIQRQHSRRLRESQPWMQLAILSQALGDEKGAHHAIYRLVCHRATKSPFLIRRGKVILGWVREQPFRIGLPILIILLVATLVFSSASSAGAIAPREKDAYSAWSKGQPFPVAYPRFNALIYSLENELPLVKLGQDDKWAPDPAHRPISFASDQYLSWTRVFNSYNFLMTIRWLLILLGWIQATVLAAALGNRFKS